MYELDQLFYWQYFYVSSRFSDCFRIVFRVFPGIQMHQLPWVSIHNFEALKYIDRRFWTT